MDINIHEVLDNSPDLVDTCVKNDVQKRDFARGQGAITVSCSQ